MPPDQAERVDYERGLDLLKAAPSVARELVSLTAQLAPAERSRCPKCGATTVQIVTLQKRNLGAALLAEWVLDSTAAGVTAGSKTVLCNACVACGFQWLPGSPQEAIARLVVGQLGDDTRRRIFTELERQAQKSQEEQDRSHSQLAAVAGIAAVVGFGIWVYSALLSPTAKQLQRTGAWIDCVVKAKGPKMSDCGPSPSEDDRVAWFKRHMETWPDRQRQITVESLLALPAPGAAPATPLARTRRDATDRRRRIAIDSANAAARFWVACADSGATVTGAERTCGSIPWPPERDRDTVDFFVRTGVVAGPVLENVLHGIRAHTDSIQRERTRRLQAAVDSAERAKEQ